MPRISLRSLLPAALLLLAAPARAEPTAAEPPADPAFAACLADLAAVARSLGLPDALVRERLDGLTPDPAVTAATGTQSEFVRPIWSYLDAAVTEARIAEGRAKLVELAPVLERIEARYGVDRHVLVAFWGIESGYGAVLADPGVVRPVLRSLATLACTDPGRPAYWRDELTAALRILARGDGPRDPVTGAPTGVLTGSWAGAMGHTQFMPSVTLAHAVDFDGDGRADIWGSVPDALASTAAYLVAAGWRRDESWGAEARLPPGFDYALADETTRRPLSQWAGLGVVPVRPSPPADVQDSGKQDLASLILPAGARGPAFLLAPNFAAILRYNTSLSYALAVGHLADRLRGGPGLAGDWPRGDRTLGADERRDLQARLAGRGHDAGPVDGKIGPRTRAAVRAFQSAVGLPADGYADAALLERLRAP